MAAFGQTLLPALPLLYLGLSELAFAISLHARNQGQRLAILPLILIPAYLSLSTVKYVWFAPGIALLWAQALTGYALHTVSILHLEKIPPPCFATNPGSAARRSNITGFDWVYFRRFWLNPRLIDINLHPTDPALPQKEKPKKQSRMVFLILQISKLLIYYIAQTKISPALFDETLIDILPNEVVPYQQSLWRPFSAGFTKRGCLTVTFVTHSSFWTTFVYLDGTNALLAIIFVTIGLDDPEDWPPLFGNASQAVGMRNFWSKSWHSLPTKPYKSIGGLSAPRYSGCLDRSRMK